MDRGRGDFIEGCALLTFRGTPVMSVGTQRTHNVVLEEFSMSLQPWRSSSNGDIGRELGLTILLDSEHPRPLFLGRSSLIHLLLLLFGHYAIVIVRFSIRAINSSEFPWGWNWIIDKVSRGDGSPSFPKHTSKSIFPKGFDTSPAKPTKSVLVSLSPAFTFSGRFSKQLVFVTLSSVIIDGKEIGSVHQTPLLLQVAFSAGYSHLCDDPCPGDNHSIYPGHPSSTDLPQVLVVVVAVAFPLPVFLSGHFGKRVLDEELRYRNYYSRPSGNLFPGCFDRVGRLFGQRETSVVDRRIERSRDSPALLAKRLANSGDLTGIPMNDGSS
ncbi:hypothetical protein Tco_0218448 [Tanacetum coccineum]